MTRLIGIPGTTPTDNGAAALWVNPDRIVSIAPRPIGVSPTISLTVEVKLEGVPLFTAHFGHFATMELVDQRWHAFLAEIAGAQ